MNEDFVTKEITQKLKEKGYPIDTRIEGKFGLTKVKRVDVSPTISQVLKWLREEKKIYLEIVIVVDTEYMCDIYKIEPKPIECLGSTEYFKTYEQAVIAGIEHVLNLI